MGGARRSGRIAKEVAVVLLGTDTLGRVFSEETRTVVLSRHGAGVISTHKLAPDEILTLRLPGSNKEVDVRLVGHMGQEARGYIYGLAFRDPHIDFWKIEFPSSPERAGDPACALECSFCKDRQVVHPSEIEADVYAITQGILRYCNSCGTSTLWRQVASSVVAPRATPRLSSPLDGTNRVAPAPARSPSSSAPQTGPSKLVLITTGKKAAVDVALPETAPAEASLPSNMLAATVSRANRRRDVRTRVSFTACIRHPASGDELVECDNVSKGGLCFRSRKSYAMDSVIEIAVPYSPGQHAIFVSACVKRIQQLPSGTQFRYGVAYVPSGKASGGF